jgi:hypothetical protein
MTEAEWQTCTDPERMLAALNRRASARKRRLFAVACCRRIWPLLDDEALRQTVLQAERLAEQPASREDWARCRRPAIERAKQRRREGTSLAFPYYAVLAAADAVAREAALGTANQAAWAVALARADQNRPQRDLTWAAIRDAVHAAERQAQADLLRDVFRPFAAPSVGPAWLAYNGGAVAPLARAVYEEGRWQDLPVLADALEEAGCSDEAILGHLRGPGPHVRGCWVVDAILGRQ